MKLFALSCFALYVQASNFAGDSDDGENRLFCDNQKTRCEQGWMCNFDNRKSGFCENCAHFPTIDDCIARVAKMKIKITKMS